MFGKIEQTDFSNMTKALGDLKFSPGECFFQNYAENEVVSDNENPYLYLLILAPKEEDTDSFKVIYKYKTEKCRIKNCENSNCWFWHKESEKRSQNTDPIDT